MKIGRNFIIYVSFTIIKKQALNLPELEHAVSCFEMPQNFYKNNR